MQSSEMYVCMYVCWGGSWDFDSNGDCAENRVEVVCMRVCIYIYIYIHIHIY